MPSKFDNRTDRRLHLKKPANGHISEGVVSIMNLSITGIGIEHPFQIKPGLQTFLEFAWGGTVLRLWCTVAHSRPKRDGDGFRTGLIVGRGASEKEYKERVKEAIRKMIEAEKQQPSSL